MPFFISGGKHMCVYDNNENWFWNKSDKILVENLNLNIRL